jgi:hypothetical protein
MKTKTAFLALALICICVVSHSQTKEKSSEPSFKRNVIGFSFNGQTWDRKFITNDYSLRYGYKIARPFTIGAEITGFFPNGNFPEFTYPDPDFTSHNWFNLSTNLFFRYSLRSDKRLQFFVEASPYAKFLFTKQLDYRWGDFFVYIAPGVSVFSKNRKFSMDLYYRISTENNYRGNLGSLAYKLNFHF